MKLYSGRKIDRMIARRFRTHTESRDAIVWDVDTSTGVARCKVQGSDEFVLCHYPQNWEKIPYYVKPGFAVRLIHKGGNKGFQEISGPGRAIPSPVEGAVLPPPPQLFNGIMSGMEITAPLTGMYVEIAAGVYRISGLNYSYNTGAGGTFMNDPPEITLGDEVLMGAGTNALLIFDTAPSIPNARYDLIVIAADGIADVVKGTASQDPQFPEIPVNHIKIGHVLIFGGTTVITQSMINAAWEPRKIHNLSFTLSGTYAASNTSMYGEIHNANPIVTIRVTILDQYGWSFNIPHSINLTKDSGSGWIDIGDNNWVEFGSITKTTGSSVSYSDFRYKRNEVLIGSPATAIDPNGEIPFVSLRADMSIAPISIYSSLKLDLLFVEP